MTKQMQNLQLKQPLIQQEIEIKIKTTDHYMKLLEDWLQKNALFQGSETHKEFYLDNPQSTFFFSRPDGEKDALKYLRVRYSEKRGSVCLKDWHQDPETGNTTHCDEFEVTVSDPDIMLALFERLGYTNKTKMAKFRRKFSAGEYEIVIDDVESLGIFVEIELKKSVVDIKAALLQLENFLVNTIGITEYWIQTRGYASRLRNPHMQFGEYRNHEKKALKL